jgi:hypothetical protein
MRLPSAWLVAVAFATVQTTVWGGDHVRMNVTRSGAELEFDCATGTITEAVPDTDGDFSLKGTFTPERSGPSRGDRSRTVMATYSGTIDRDTMTLHIVLEGQDREASQYVLSRGRTGMLRKCR